MVAEEASDASVRKYNRERKGARRGGNKGDDACRGSRNGRNTRNQQENKNKKQMIRSCCTTTREKRRRQRIRSREFAFHVGRRLGRAEEKREKSGISGQGTAGTGYMLAGGGEVHADSGAADRVLRDGPGAAAIWAAGEPKYRQLLQTRLPGRVLVTWRELRFFFFALAPVDRVTQCFAYGRSLVSAQQIISPARPSAETLRHGSICIPIHAAAFACPKPSLDINSKLLFFASLPAHSQLDPFGRPGV